MSGSVKRSAARRCIRAPRICTKSTPFPYHFRTLSILWASPFWRDLSVKTAFLSWNRRFLDFASEFFLSAFSRRCRRAKELRGFGTARITIRVFASTLRHRRLGADRLLVRDLGFYSVEKERPNSRLCAIGGGKKLVLYLFARAARWCAPARSARRRPCDFLEKTAKNNFQNCDFAFWRAARRCAPARSARLMIDPLR